MDSSNDTDKEKFLLDKMKEFFDARKKSESDSTGAKSDSRKSYQNQQVPEQETFFGSRKVKLMNINFNSSSVQGEEEATQEAKMTSIPVPASRGNRVSTTMMSTLSTSNLNLKMDLKASEETYQEQDDLEKFLFGNNVLQNQKSCRSERKAETTRERKHQQGEGAQYHAQALTEEQQKSREGDWDLILGKSSGQGEKNEIDKERASDSVPRNYREQKTESNCNGLDNFFGDDKFSETSEYASGSSFVNDQDPTSTSKMELLKMLADYKQKDCEAFTAPQTPTPPTRSQNRKSDIQSHKESLPIFKFRKELLKMVKDNQVVIVRGDTGCGKSTQIPQYLMEAGYAETGQKIGITQPRRLGATQLAQRVADELCERKVGGLVGYAVRFDKQTSTSTVIKYMTDGILVKECSRDTDFEEYSVVIVDEAHERTLHTEVCLGLLKRAIERRPDLKVIISSATLEQEKFSEFFDKAPSLCIQGRRHDVEVVYKPLPDSKDYLDHASSTVIDIHRKDEKGDILVFLPGKDEIDKVAAKVRKFTSACDLWVVPCHSSLPLKEQQKIYEPPPGKSYRRKVVLATNIAETSLTIDGIVHVVDSGLFKQTSYNPRTKISSLNEQWISKFQAIQRQGRAGRTCPGKCYRLYSEAEFNEFDVAPEPDIKRSNLESILLDLYAIGVTDPFKFEFMDQPPAPAVLEAIIHLQELSALDQTLELTPLGCQMAALPVDPPLAKILITSQILGCDKDVVIIAAMLSAQQHRNMFVRCKDTNRQRAAARSKARFAHKDGDLLTLWNIFNEWVNNPSENKRQKWCIENFIEGRHLEEASAIRNQLTQILKSSSFSIVCTKSTAKPGSKEWSANIRKAFTSGYFRQIALHCKGDKYEPVMVKFATAGTDESNKTLVSLHHSSVLATVDPKPKWVIFHEITKNNTRFPFMRDMIVIESAWFLEYGKEFAARFRDKMGLNKDANKKS